MNINQQAEIEELFRRINKNIQKNSKAKITDEDLTKVRAYVVQSQRPLQAVRLLQKEREERDIDSRFTQQKEEIIQKAYQLDEERKQFMQQQQEQIETVHKDMDQMANNQLKRKKEDEKLKTAENQVQQHKKAIEQLKANIVEKQQLLEVRKQELEDHKKFSDFLESATHDKELGESSEVSIEWLRSRFTNLKNERKKLKQRKRQINQQMEETRRAEKEKLSELSTELFNKQKEMSKLQTTLEKVSEMNAEMEQDFENEINKKNDSSKEIGQIFSTINNIFSIIQKVAKDRGRHLSSNNFEITDINKKDPEKIKELIVALDQAHEYLEDLEIVSKMLKPSQIENASDIIYEDKQKKQKAQKTGNDMLKRIPQPTKQQNTAAANTTATAANNKTGTSMSGIQSVQQSTQK